MVRGNQAVALLIAGAALVALVTALLLWARAPDYRVLFSNLSEADGGRIISELDARAVPYRFSQGGQALLVPGDQVHSLRMQLAEQGLPQGGNVGFELMEDQPFGISQFAEQVNYQRGLEGELSRSIESLSPVERARVHIAMAQPSVFVRESEPAKASVVLTLQGGRRLNEGQINAIRHFVASSVPELAIEEVTLVDHRGRMLSQNPDPDKMDVTQLEYRGEVENAYQRRIETILEPLFGTGRVRAQVAAQIDFSHREETSERYAPNQPPNEASVRSRQSNVSYTGDDDLVGGIPGALSNTPPGVAPSPIDLPEPDEDAEPDPDPEADADADEANGADAAFASTKSLQRDDVVNYEVDRSVAHVRQQRGRLQRLSAAVVVDHRRELDENGEWQTVAPSEEELAQVERLAREAMGFSAERGDSIAVVSSPFSRQDQGPAPEWWQDPETIQLAVMLGEPLLWIFGLLLVYLLLLRPFIKHYTRPPQAPVASEAGVDAKVGDEDEGEDTDEDEEDAEIYEKPRKNKALGYQQKLAELREMAQRDPQIIALIVRNWLQT
nr:flagellar basal-body MS-ring/collar protein FliF [Halochromatium salexigens]